MQMTVGLRIRLSKQMEIKIGKKEKKQQKKPSGLCQEEKKCRFYTQSKRETLFENLKRKAEGECSPQRFLTQICNTMMPYRKASWLTSIFSFMQVIADCIRIEILWRMMDNPPKERPATIPLPLSDITHVHVVSVSEIVITSWYFYFLCTPKVFKMTTGI